MGSDLLHDAPVAARQGRWSSGPGVLLGLGLGVWGHTSGRTARKSGLHNGLGQHVWEFLKKCKDSY